MKRKTNQSKSSSDFKRIKAKVGKRAPKAINVTETSFQTSSLHIHKQSIDPNSSTNNKNVQENENKDMPLCL